MVYRLRFTMGYGYNYRGPGFKLCLVRNLPDSSNHHSGVVFHLHLVNVRTKTKDNYPLPTHPHTPHTRPPTFVTSQPRFRYKQTCSGISKSKHFRANRSDSTCEQWYHYCVDDYGIIYLSHCVYVVSIDNVPMSIVLLECLQSLINY